MVKYSTIIFKWWTLLVCTTCFLGGPCLAKNILCVYPIPSKSHHVMFQPITRGLVRNGHNVTVIWPYRIDDNSTNLHQIILRTSLHKILDDVPMEIILQIGSNSLWEFPILQFWEYVPGSVVEYLEAEPLQKLIHSKEDKFDLIMLETSFGQEAFLGFSHKFDAPVVTINTMVNFFIQDEYIGNPLWLSILPHYESRLASPMNFFQRLYNVVRSSVILFNYYYFKIPQQEEIMKTYFNYTDPERFPPLLDMLVNNVSIVLSNSHVALEYPRALVPALIPAAGLHIKKQIDPLTKELQKFMDDATEGVVYISFGTIIPTHRFPANIKQTFLRSCGKLKQKVLWKANVDHLEGLPDNVKVAKWVPQQSVLAHRNCKAFIMQGGLLSLQEAIYFGIPIVGIPFIVDQHINVRRAEKLGYAYLLEYSDITEQNLDQAMDAVINDNRYTESARKFSRIFRDHPLEPLDNVLYWIEYVMRHDGAKHLRSPKLDLTFYQYNLIDVIAFVLCIIIVLATIIYRVIKLLFSYTITKNMRYKFDRKKKKN